jgi:Carboxypeptidase regulatory-like domain
LKKQDNISLQNKPLVTLLLQSMAAAFDKKRIMKSTLTLILLLIAIVLLPAQDWKKQAKQADKLFDQGQFEEAAALYESAWEKKQSKTNLMYKAGECYYALRDFRRASDAFYKVKNATGEAGLAGLKYARSLKQCGEYDQAKEELVYYIKRYKEKDKTFVSNIVQTEIEGCELAQQLALKDHGMILIEHLSENINTLEDEFAPVPFSDDILYFSSTTGNSINMYRSQRQSGLWTPAVVPDLPKVSGGATCNGTFSPDNSRFYFTVCQSQKSWAGAETPCDIYVTKKENQVWSEPQKLHDYIKDNGTTATHPFVVHRGEEEILFFVSDREGGFGGLDIWFAKRQIKEDDIDFTLPQNAGPMVNTMGNEISPFYNELKESLFFSSKGHPSIGGFDIYESMDKGGRFLEATNIGTPFNSPNDDFFYKEDKNGNGGFLVSNRLFGLEKITSTHDDIFFFTTARNQIVIKGTVTDNNTGNPMESVVASLFEVKSNNRKRLLQAKTFPNGNYEFVLLPDKEYSLTVEQVGFGSSKYNFSTFNPDTISIYTRDFVLEPGRAIEEETMASNSNTTPPVTANNSSRPINTNSDRLINNNTPSSNSAISTRPSNPAPAPRKNVTSEAPVHTGVYYKVQLTVVIDYNPNQSQFREVKNMGRLDTEFLPEKKWNRVLLADFFNIEDAHVAMVKAQKLGFFDAFLVKYRDGKRVTP